MKSEVQQSIGDGWLSLAAELQRQLREQDPAACVHPAVGPTGLLQLQLHTTRGHRARALALARQYEDKARRTCERCGVEVASRAAGSVITVLCTDCCR